MLSSGNFGSGWKPTLSELDKAASLLASKTGPPPKPKRKRPKFIRKVECQVCGDVANDHIHYGAIACYSCRAFFRRGINSNAQYYCSHNQNCSITKATRKHCQYCRFEKCLSVGMRGTWVMTEEDKREKKEKALCRKIERIKNDEGKKDILQDLTAEPIITSLAQKLEQEDDGESTTSERISEPGTSKRSESRRSYHPRRQRLISSSKSSPYIAPTPTSAPSTSGPLTIATSTSASAPSPSPSSASETFSRVGDETSSIEEINPSPEFGSTWDYNSSLSLSPSSTLSLGSPELRSPPDVSFFVDNNVNCNLTGQPVMPFTYEENELVQTIMRTEVETTEMIKVSPEVLMTMVKAAQTGSVIPYKILIEGYTTCLQRIVKMASKLDFFGSFPQEDQKQMLLSNADMVVNIRSARLLRPGQNLQTQLKHIVGGDGATSNMITTVQPYQQEPSKIQYRQIYQSPWACDASHEEKFSSLMESLFHLQMDRTTTILMSMIVLFASENLVLKERDKCIRNQEFFIQLLYRYLCSVIGKQNANNLLPKYMELISKLEEMAQIMITKRLTL